MEELIHHFEELISLSDQDKELIRTSFTKKTYKKKEIVEHAGVIASHMRFITKGCVRMYCTNSDGDEHILSFGTENWWVTDMDSYVNRIPGNQTIQALEETTLLEISKKRMDELYLLIPQLNVFFAQKLQRAYIKLQQRTINAMSRSAESRYQMFREDYPDLEQRVPLYMIAAFLGITPEHLSKIRKLSANHTS